MPYELREVDATDSEIAELILDFNRLEQSWPPLQERHLEQGYWWMAYLDNEPVAFAGLVEMIPFPLVGYCKRCYVKPDHHGHGLQFRMLAARELKSKQLGWTMLVSECSADNSFSYANFRKAGFNQVDPEQPWARNSIYWVKVL